MKTKPFFHAFCRSWRISALYCIGLSQCSNLAGTPQVQQLKVEFVQKEIQLDISSRPDH